MSSRSVDGQQVGGRPCLSNGCLEEGEAGSVALQILIKKSTHVGFKPSIGDRQLVFVVGVIVAVRKEPLTDRNREVGVDIGRPVHAIVVCVLHLVEEASLPVHVGRKIFQLSGACPVFMEP